MPWPLGEVREACWIFGHGLYTTRRNVLRVATVALFSIFRLHCSFIHNCNHGQTISNLLAWRINVVILPSLIYLSTCALSSAIFRSHTVLATVCLTEALVLQHKPLTCDKNGGASEKSGIMAAACTVISQKQFIHSRLHAYSLGSHALQHRGHSEPILIAGVKNVD